MQLKQDLIREVLLYLEENRSVKDVISSDAIEINGYSEEEVVYTLLKLKEAGYINSGNPCFSYDLPLLLITGLTWEGHKFLDNIKDDTIWEKTKEATRKFKSVSISVLENVAASILTNMLLK